MPRRLDPATYEPHALHRASQIWTEKNCYIDLWIELLHARGLDPMPLLAFTVRHDFVDDQWVFYKPSPGDLSALYGIDVYELNVFRPLLDHMCTHVAAERTVLAEVDAFFLPDTAGTDYRAKHSKTTIGIDYVDADARELRYFHNRGYYALAGDDFTQLFAPRLDGLPLFAEIVSTTRMIPPTAHGMASVDTSESFTLFARYLQQRPQDNPIDRFSTHFCEEIERLAAIGGAEGTALYHAYAFATLRQLGSNFELLVHYLRWLADHGEHAVHWAVPYFEQIASVSQLLVLKAARAVHARKTIDCADHFRSMSESWRDGMRILADSFEP